MEFVDYPAIFSSAQSRALGPNPGVGALTSGKTYSQHGEKGIGGIRLNECQERW